MNRTLSITKRLFASIVLAFSSWVAWAIPSVEAVQAEVQRGNYAQAEAMMREVVAAKPGSARAHYVYAEVLARNGRFGQAAQELRQARQIDLAVGFTDPEKFRAFERLLERQQERARTARAVPPAPEVTPAAPLPASRQQVDGGGFGGFGWVWILGFMVLAMVVWRMVARARRAAATAPMLRPAGGYGAVPGHGPMYGSTVPSGTGSGMLGVGMAAAGGFAAGMLAEKMLDGMQGHDGKAASHLEHDGAFQPGMFDDPGRDDAAMDDLERHPVDFGTGEDWGGDDGGFSDAAGSDGGDGW